MASLREEAQNELLTNEELALLFGYCARLARLVSPRDAREYFGFTFDGCVIDTFYGLAVMYGGGGISHNAEEFKRDELYGPTLRQMLKDIEALLDGPGIKVW